MKYLKYTFILFTCFLIFSCSKNLYPTNYEPINVFLETQKIDKTQKYVLVRDKTNSIELLRLFNGGDGIEHKLHPIDPIDFTGGLFKEMHWEKMYKTYVNDTLPKYWKKEDFPDYDFILENRKGLLNSAFYERYLNTRIETLIMLSEPIYYENKKYIMFYYNKSSFYGDNNPTVVIMTKQKDKWVVVRIIGDYIFY